MMLSGRILKCLSFGSAVIPAGMSYVLNIYAASVFEINDYASYVFLISVATYLGTIANGGFVDLGVRETKVELIGHSKNLVLSVYSSLVFSVITFIFVSYFSVSHGLALTIFVLFFSITRSYHLFLANNSLSINLLISRAFRGLVLLSAPLLFLVLSKLSINTNIDTLFVIQSLGLAAGLLVAREVIWAAPAFFQLDKSYLPSRADFYRLGMRCVSLAVDLVHMPICFYCVKSLSESGKISNLEVLVFGLSVPIASLLTQILTERVRAKFASIDLHDLYASIPKLNPYVLCVSAVSLVVLVHILSVLVDIDAVYLSLLIVFVVNKFISSFSGVVFYKAGLESVDLMLNIGVTVFMASAILLLGVDGTTVFYSVFALLVAKYVGANCFVYCYARKNV